MRNYTRVCKSIHKIMCNYTRVCKCIYKIMCNYTKVINSINFFDLGLKYGKFY